MHETADKIEKALAISIKPKGCNRELALEHLDELEFLAETAGAEIIEKIYQELAEPNPSTVVGKGKLEEIAQIVKDNDINLVVFDDDLTPAQTRNLSTKLEIKVIDRSGLILDIFARRAQTLEAKTQVELAQLQYMLPRLTRMWTHLSKQYGGIGTKGPGETQIETDRRMIRTRIQRLKEKLAQIDMQRIQQRKGRLGIPRFALVGYTNAGKSTLMNAITDSSVYVENKLFATLDTTVRGFTLPSGAKALLSDTVGFIRKLPTHLVASFRSTLSEAAEADVIVHVVDISYEFFRENIAAVNETLESLNIKEKPLIIAFNKIDRLEHLYGLRAIEEEFPKSVFISAERGINLSALLERMQFEYEKQSNQKQLLLPYSKMDILSKIYDTLETLEREDTDDGILLKVKVPADKVSFYDSFFRVFEAPNQE
ncbi:MAG: GTPase HflX [Chloroflexota bacterium]